VVPGQPGEKKKKFLRCHLNNKKAGVRTQKPEFKSSYNQKEKKQKEIHLLDLEHLICGSFISFY
jgi:hypothetical protein